VRHEDNHVLIKLKQAYLWKVSKEWYEIYAEVS
jgi:hypothetical protein